MAKSQKRATAEEATNPPLQPPIRTCVGCGTKRAQRQLLRVASHEGAEPAIDGGQHAPGRGAYVCFDSKCVERALQRRAFERALKLKGGLPETVRDELVQVVRAQADEHKRG